MFAFFGYSANKGIVISSEKVTVRGFDRMEIQYSTAYFEKLDLLEILYAGQAALKETLPTHSVSKNQLERFEQIEAAIAKLNKEIRILELNIIQSVVSK